MHVEKVTERNYTYVSSMLTVVALLIGYELLSLFVATSKGENIELDLLKVLVLFYLLVLSAYFIRILEFVAASNAQQRKHISMLHIAKLKLAQRCWQKASGERWHRLFGPDEDAEGEAATSSGEGRTFLLQRRQRAEEIEEITKLCELLDHLIGNLKSNDTLCRVIGMYVDDAYRVKLLVLLLAGMAAPIFEVLLSS